MNLMSFVFPENQWSADLFHKGIDEIVGARIAATLRQGQGTIKPIVVRMGAFTDWLVAVAPAGNA